MKKIETIDQPNLLLPDTENQWLEDAKDINVYHCSGVKEFNTLTDRIYNEIQGTIIINNKYRSKQTLKMLLLNIWVDYIADYPMMYSRNPNNYNHDKRYGKLFFKYNRVIGIMDTLEALGYIEQRLGYFNHEDGIKRRTRAYPSELLIQLFNEYLNVSYDVVHRLPPQEIIQLKDDNKNLRSYTDSEWTTTSRLNLYRYNNFIQQQEIEIDIPCGIPINTDFINDLKYNLISGVIELDYLEFYPERIGGLKRRGGEQCCNEIAVAYNDNNINKLSINHLDLFQHDPLPIIYHKDTLFIDYSHNHYHNHKLHHNYSNIQDIINTITNKVLIDSKSFTDGKDNKEKIKLNELGIGKLIVRIAYNRLHRVFNKCSFEFGGRYYGALHLGIQRDIRLFSTINGRPVVELDYKALHIRMLYHIEGIYYPHDPYGILCNSPDERKMWKLVQLVSINAEDETKAVKAMRNEFRKNHIKHKITNEALYPLLEKFKTAHKPIAKYLTSGVGIELQNIDSRITDGILNSFVEDGIPILPVHDSFIIEKKYEGILWERMTDEYQQGFGFKPVIEKK